MTESEKIKKVKELKEKLIKVKAEHDYYKALQLGLKLVLNGSYGAFCHSAFAISNSEIANAITATSREVINLMLDNIENYFYNLWFKDKKTHDLLGQIYITKFDNGYYPVRKDGTLIDNFPRYDDNKKTGIEKIFNDYHLSNNDIIDNDKKEFIINNNKHKIIHKIFIADFSNVNPIENSFIKEPNPAYTKDTGTHEHRGIRKKPIIIYGDTDSVDKNTVINTNKGNMIIEEMYNKGYDSAGITLKGHESVKTDLKVLNYDNKLYYTDVKRIIRHKVKKQKWKLKTKSGKEIFVTNDHSMIVFRNSIKIKVKPSEILKTDKILTIVE